MDDSRKNCPAPEGQRKRNCSRKLQADHLPTNDVEIAHWSPDKVDSRPPGQEPTDTTGTERLHAELQRDERPATDRQSHRTELQEKKDQPTVMIKRGKLVAGRELLLSDGERIKEVDDSVGYKYLGILQSDAIKKQDAKDLVKREYFRRTRLALQSELNAGNTVRAIASWAVPVIRYTAGVVEWTVAELQEIDRKTRKLLTIHRAFNMNGDVDRLYIGRNQGGKGLLQVEQVVREEERALSEYVRSARGDWLMEIVRREDVLLAEESKGEYRK
jgi:hypothetical protein